MIENESFLVTGAAGFIGSHITEFLLNHGAKHVRVLDNLSNGKMENVEIFQNHPNYEFIKGDITDFDTCAKACRGMDKICHQAAVGSVPRSIENPINTNNSNVSGFLNMLFAAQKEGIDRFVYASSSSVYGDDQNLPKVEEVVGTPMSPYAVSKKTNELYAKVYHQLHGMKIIGLRYFNVYGPRQDPYGQYAAVIPLFIKGLLNNEDVYIDGDGEQTRDFTYVLSAVQANISALTTDNEKAFGEVYNVAHGENFSINEIYNALKSELGIESQPIYRAARAGDVRNSLANVSKAKERLNYNSVYPISKGLPVTVQYFKSVFEKTDK